MAVFRVERTRDYTVMCNHHLKDSNLSLKAKGLLSMMLSLPDEWNYTTRGLATICKEGVDAIGKTLKELELAGYIIRRQLRGKDGRISDTEYTIFEKPRKPSPPDTTLPDTENPYLDNPDTEAPDTDNPAQLNTKKSNIKGKNAKKFRKNLEYGSARWGTAEDIKPYVDPAFENNIILTQTERLTMNSRPKDPKTARNKNVLIVGGSGSGKTRFWLKPNLLQCTSKTYPTSFVVTDPKGDIVVSCGHALQKNGYQIKILNSLNFKKSISSVRNCGIWMTRTLLGVFGSVITSRPFSL